MERLAKEAIDKIRNAEISADQAEKEAAKANQEKQCELALF